MIKYFLSLLTMLATTSLAAPLLTTTQSWDAGSIAYPVGQAEIASIVLRLEEGKAATFSLPPSANNGVCAARNGASGDEVGGKQPR